MIQPATDLTISSHDLELGLARRPCSYCRRPLVIRLPSMHDAITGQESAALRLGLEDLTMTEREIFDAVYAFYPHAVARTVVDAAVRDMLNSTLSTNIWRMRPKLAAHGWLLLTQQGALRLVEPTHIVDC